jgi:SAM-dependent methyltransferase
MTGEPIVWHYGLMAERWAELITETPELDFFRKAIDRFGQPVLDLACGPGRLLLPFLESGVDIDGCDISGDMLAKCRLKAAGAGLRPHLYEQPMHTVDLPRRYRTIYICGSFGLAGSRANDLETLRRCFSHLEEDGALLLNIQAEYNSPEAWEIWLPGRRQSLPDPWPQDGKSQLAPDGSEHRAYFRTLEFNALEQTYTRQVRLEKWDGGKLLATEERILKGNVYMKNEVQLMLKVAGFRTISVTGDYTDEIATSEHEEIVFTAVK